MQAERSVVDVIEREQLLKLTSEELCDWLPTQGVNQETCAALKAEDFDGASLLDFMQEGMAEMKLKRGPTLKLWGSVACQGSSKVVGGRAGAPGSPQLSHQSRFEHEPRRRFHHDVSCAIRSCGGRRRESGEPCRGTDVRLGEARGREGRGREDRQQPRRTGKLKDGKVAAIAPGQLKKGSSRKISGLAGKLGAGSTP